MKRYVLLDNNLIYDRNKLDKDKDWLIIRILEKIDSGETNSNLVRTIKQQSDNLIDLLEVGDMVETVVNELDTDIIYVSDEIDLKYVRDDYNILVEEEQVILKAIWKRNGDIMRRYSVE